MGRKNSLIYLVLITAIIALTGLLMFKYLFLDKNLPIGEVKRLEVEKELVPISNSSILFAQNGMMIESENTNLRARNMDCNVLWSMKLKGSANNIISCGKDIAVNIDNKSIATISKNGEMLWQYDMVIPATNILCSDNGLLLIQYKEGGHNSFEIFSIKGVRHCSATINNAHVISFDGTAGKNYTVSLLDTSSDKVMTKIATYNNKGEILWASNFQDILVPKIRYNEKGELTAITEDSIKKFRGDGKLVKSVDFSNSITKVLLGNNYILSIVKNKGFYDVFVHDYNLKQIGTAGVKTKPEGAAVGDNYFLLYDKDNLTLSGKQGKIIAVYESNIDINSAYINGDSDIYIISNRKLQKLTFNK